jgi:hypothetical protein
MATSSPREQRDREHRLQHRHLVGDLALARVLSAGARFLDVAHPPLGDQPQSSPRPGQAHRLDHVGRDVARRGDAVVTARLVGHEDG